MVPKTPPRGGSPPEHHGFDLPLALASTAAGIDPFGEHALEPELTPITEVDAGLVREMILGGLALVQAKVVSGRFAKMDAETLEKLLALAGQFDAIAKAVDTVQAYSPAVAVAAQPTSEPLGTSELLQTLRAIKGGKR